MPNYRYKCESCFAEFNVTHSINSTLDKCAKCGTEDRMNRVPQTFSTIIKDSGQKAGEVVKEYIEDAREDLKQQQEKIESNR